MRLDLSALDALAGIIGEKKYRVTQPGDPKRRETVYLPLLTAWAQRNYLAKDPEPYIGKAKPARWRIVRRRSA